MKMESMPERTFFNGGSIVWGVQSTDKYAAIREIISRSQVLRSVPGLHLDHFADLVIEREKISSTGFGHGVAVAHGRTPEVSGPQITLGISRDGIDYNAVDGRPVQLLFIVANHPEQQMDYLKILSALVSVVRDDAFRQELLDCFTEADLEAKLCSAFTSVMNKTKYQADFSASA